MLENPASGCATQQKAMTAFLLPEQSHFQGGLSTTSPVLCCTWRRTDLSACWLC